MNHISNNESQTAEIARNLAKTLQNRDIICLSGDLGAGKSVFCRAIIRYMCKNNNLEVPSPTFTLVQNYDAEIPIYHFDLYRLEDPEEIYEIGWEEAQYNGISLIEWPQRLGTLLPSKRIDITITTQNDTRHIHIEQKT